jgi:hypothetical protein
MHSSTGLHGFGKLPTKAKVKKSRSRVSLQLEGLEDRCLPAIYNPVAVAGISPQPVQGSPLSLNSSLGTFMSADPVGDLSAAISFNGAGALAASKIEMVGSEFVPGLGNVPEYSIMPPTFSPTTFGPGALAFQLTISDDGDNTTAEVNGAADVAPTPLTLVSTTISPRVATGNPLVGIDLAKFTASTTATVGDFSGTIDWGDGSPLSAALIDATGSGAFTVAGSHTYLKAGSIPNGIVITVQELSSAQSFTTSTGVLVQDPFAFDSSPSLSGTVGTPLTNVQVARFTDPIVGRTPSDYEATITNWGDGASDSATTIVETSVDGTGAHFAVMASHTYVAALPTASNIAVQVQDLAVGSFVASTTTPVSVPPVRELTGLEAFVNGLYQQELGRSGSNAELDAWLPLLHLPGGQAAVANDIATSTEARDDLVKGWYVTYLGRPAAGNEEQVWAKQLLSGQTEEQTLSAILGTAEFFNHAQTVIATGTPQERLVQSLYKLLLNRNGSASDAAGWVHILPQLGQQSVAAQFLATSEYRSDLVDSYYTAFLRRPPEQAGLEFWVTSNLDSTKIRASIEASEESFFDGLT